MCIRDSFNFVGRFVPPAFGEVELTPEELEEIRKREAVSYTHLDVYKRQLMSRKERPTMTKPREKTREELQAEIEDGKKKIRQFENREKMLLSLIHI